LKYIHICKGLGTVLGWLTPVFLASSSPCHFFPRFKADYLSWTFQ
jgi:hypothetical protein